MAENNGNNGNQKAPEFVCYNLFGIRPVKATFQLDCDQLEKLIKQIASQEISGIEEVTFELDQKTGIVRWFLWFRANSEHFQDKSTNNTMINSALNRLSPEFRTFARKFGWTEADDNPGKGDNKVRIEKIMKYNVNPEVRGKLICLPIAINQILFTVFDMLNTTYTKTYGVNPPKTKLRREWIYRKGPTGEYHALVGISIEKTLANLFTDRAKPKANRSGRFM